MGYLYKYGYYQNDVKMRTETKQKPSQCIVPRHQGVTVHCTVSYILLYSEPVAVARSYPLFIIKSLVPLTQLVRDTCKVRQAYDDIVSNVAFITQGMFCLWVKILMVNCCGGLHCYDKDGCECCLTDVVKLGARLVLLTRNLKKLSNLLLLFLYAAYVAKQYCR